MNVFLTNAVNIYFQIFFIVIRCICCTTVYSSLLVIINQKVPLGQRGRVFSIILAVSGLLYVLGPLAVGLFIENAAGLNEDVANTGLIVIAILLNVIEIFCVYKIKK